VDDRDPQTSTIQPSQTAILLPFSKWEWSLGLSIEKCTQSLSIHNANPAAKHVQPRKIKPEAIPRGISSNGESLIRHKQMKNTRLLS
jgi:hypothetical protein